MTPETLTQRVGDFVTWLYTPRGGYGYRFPVDGVVTKLGVRRVQIEVQHYSGLKRIWVTPEKLVARALSVSQPRETT